MGGGWISQVPMTHVILRAKGGINKTTLLIYKHFMYICNIQLVLYPSFVYIHVHTHTHTYALPYIHTFEQNTCLESMGIFGIRHESWGI
jgi:hypothetical protein